MHQEHTTNFTCRLSKDVHEKLKRLARRHRRSVNSEINFVLAQYVDQAETPLEMMLKNPTGWK